MGAQGTTTVDFGAGFTDLATKVVIGQAAIIGTSLVEAWLDPTQPVTATPNTQDEHVYAEIDVRVKDLVVGTGFTITARARGPYGFSGIWNVSWVWN